MSKVTEFLECELKEIEQRHKVELDDVYARQKTEKEEVLAALNAVHRIGNFSIKTTTQKYKMTVNVAVIEAINNGRKKPLDILEFIETQLGMKTTIASIRVRVSKLLKSKEIARDSNGYKPVSKNEKPPDAKTSESLDFTGESAPTTSTALLPNDGASDLKMPGFLKR